MVVYTGSGTSNKAYYHADWRGSIVALSDSSGALADRFTYSSFGEVDDPTGNPFRFTGQRIDAETGLYHYRARYYSSSLGRFLQTDPIGYDDQMNLYAYVGNDPVNLIDPSGEAGLLEFVAGALLEVGRQVVTGEIKDTNLSGLARNAAKVAVAGGLGATGAGLGRGIANLTTSIAGRTALNGGAGAAIGATNTVAFNALDGENLGDGIGTGAAFGAAGGALGSVVGDAVDGVRQAAAETAFDELPTAVKNLADRIGSATNSAGRSPSSPTAASIGEVTANTLSNSAGTIEATLQCIPSSDMACGE